MSNLLGFAIVAFAMTFMGLASPVASSGQEPVLPRPPAETNAFDFLLGKWTFVEEPHDPRFPPKVNGAWTFSRSADGFMVVDEFRTFNSSRETVLLGETYRAYNPDKKMWTFQGTIFQSPMVGPRNGEWDAGITTFQRGQIIDEVTNGKTINRGRIFNIKPDTFSCVFETSNDNGQTWGTPINVEAVRSRE
jgi:hypothetical protein